MTTIAINYTPSFSEKPVNRKEDFATPEAATKFLTRMKRLYPDTKEI
jgi:hypothetical protein|tara:strand:- start:90556 stop:90696 length:141 start_codon:yes stop_codon:yes gene_type:complete